MQGGKVLNSGWKGAVDWPRLVRLGLSGKEISGVLGISDRTVQVHSLKIREKLGIKNKKLNLKGFLMSL